GDGDSGDGDSGDGDSGDGDGSCGGPGQVCCTGDVCNDDGCCVGNQCVEAGESCGDAAGTCSAGSCADCGGEQQACCDGNCQAGLSCRASESEGGQCAACGTAGQACCAARSCDEGACVGLGLGTATCQTECGAPGQACCDVDLGIGGPGFGSAVGTCQAGTLCANGMCQGAPCGAPGQACCTVGGATELAVCLAWGLGCIDGTCQQCGARGQACCDGDECGLGLSCRDDRCQAPEPPNADACDEQGESCCAIQAGTGIEFEFCDGGLFCTDSICEEPTSGIPGDVTLPDVESCNEAGETCCAFETGGPGAGTFEYCAAGLLCDDSTCSALFGGGAGGFISACDEAGESCCTLGIGDQQGGAFCGPGLACVEDTCE
ncbi:MAG: hypothetical protein OXU20_16520, partial [Myxococcales bacterium]|nr:hypothetical protein [Myxococcales bacterium]